MVVAIIQTGGPRKQGVKYYGYDKSLPTVRTKNNIKIGTWKGLSRQ